MIRCLEILSLLLEWGYVVVFFLILCTFLPLRKKWPMRILAFALSDPLAAVIIYSNDLANLLGALLGFIAYIVVFYHGKWIEKLTAVLIFYPALIAMNYLMMDTGSRLFFWITNASDQSEGWTGERYLLSTGIYMVFLLLRLLFWLAAWKFLRTYLQQITSNLTIRMWLVVDILMMAPFVAVFTIIYFMPGNPVIVFPICAASIFSSFGCIYLASYICNSIQTAYYAEELEQRQAYYQERMKEEERVRSIYHDMKNHLLVLQAQAKNSGEVCASVKKLQDQMQEYENYYHTGNEFLDIIIRDKARIAQEKQIDFVTEIAFDEGNFIESLDISTIFGNALDNAMEASEKLPKAERLVSIRANRIRDMLVILVENNAAPAAAVSGRTSKKDAFWHGFGLPNMEQAVERYGGQCSIKAENGKFLLKIVIPVPQSA